MYGPEVGYASLEEDVGFQLVGFCCNVEWDGVGVVKLEVDILPFGRFYYQTLVGAELVVE